MNGEKESAPAGSQNDKHKWRSYVLETPLGLKKIARTNEGSDFSGFENEGKGTIRKLVNVEREGVGRYHDDVWDTGKRKLRNENYEHFIEVNKEMKKELWSMKKENEIL